MIKSYLSGSLIHFLKKLTTSSRVKLGLHPVNLAVSGSKGLKLFL